MLGDSGTPEGREWPPVDLLDYTQRHYRLIADDKKRYAEFHKLLSVRYPEPWVAVGYALKTRARYHRGEIFRAKRDLQRFILGEDPQKPNQYGQMLCDWITEYIYQLPEVLSELERHWSASALDPENPRARIEKSLWEGDEVILESLKKDILSTTKQLEGKIYGG